MDSVKDSIDKMIEESFIIFERKEVPSNPKIDGRDYKEFIRLLMLSVVFVEAAKDEGTDLVSSISKKGETFMESLEGFLKKNKIDWEEYIPESLSSELLETIQSVLGADLDVPSLVRFDKESLPSIVTSVLSGDSVNLPMKVSMFLKNHKVDESDFKPVLASKFFAPGYQLVDDLVKLEKEKKIVMESNNHSSSKIYDALLILKSAESICSKQQTPVVRRVIKELEEIL